MNERYLQFLWKHKRLLNPNLVLSDGREIKILNFGHHNTLKKGPDFLNASIVLDGLTFFGSIEIHVKSSDWIKHGHQLDPNYNNVILHVVFEHDCEILQNGHKLPVLELRSRIDGEHFNLFKNATNKEGFITCGFSKPDKGNIYWASMMEKSLYIKLTENVKLIQSVMSANSSALYYYLGSAFGSNLNKHAFLDLLRRVPEKELVGLNASQKYKLLISESGLLSTQSRGVNSWHFRGNRPGNFPGVRLKQFSELIGDLSFDDAVRLKNETEIIEGVKQVVDHYNLSAHRMGSKITSAFFNQILINGIVPFLWHLAEIEYDERYQNAAFQILEQLPPEKNRITSQWAKVGVYPANALESQGLIALHRYYCCHKKCLSCEVGNMILKT